MTKRYFYNSLTISDNIRALSSDVKIGDLFSKLLTCSPNCLPPLYFSISIQQVHAAMEFLCSVKIGCFSIAPALHW